MSKIGASLPPAGSSTRSTAVSVEKAGPRATRVELANRLADDIHSVEGGGMEIRLQPYRDLCSRGDDLPEFVG